MQLRSPGTVLLSGLGVIIAVLASVTFIGNGDNDDAKASVTARPTNPLYAPLLEHSSWKLGAVRRGNRPLEIGPGPILFQWKTIGEELVLSINRCTTAPLKLDERHMFFPTAFTTTTDTTCGAQLPIDVNNFVYGTLLSGKVDYLVHGDRLTLAKEGKGQLKLIGQ